MNFIANDPETQAHLSSWAGGENLVIARFFFWKAGAPMQKSQQGLLQSLLREIYGQCPELIPVLCPSRWKRYHDIGTAWNRVELSDALETLGQQSSLGLKFCFFVDGVDEYDGEDYTLIIDVLKNLNASLSVKVCISSRPWNIFTYAFGACTNQRLLLEEHNHDDLNSYVKNRLCSDERFAALQSTNPNSSDLTDEIVRNAQGVFLWVRIVVSNLLRGFSDGDSLSDLQRRLRSFPTSLTAYYQHMFDNIDDSYQEETAEILLICLEEIQPLSLLALWFYEQEKNTPNFALLAEKTPLGRANAIAVFESMHKRINARGQDLLAIETGSAEVEYLTYVVRFSHRTMKDFLSKPDMLKKLTSWTSKGFDARVSLCKATIAIATSLPSSTLIEYEMDANRWRKSLNGTDTDRWWNYISDFFTYAHLIEQGKGKVDGELVNELQRAICSFRRPDSQATCLGKVNAFIDRTFDFWVHSVNQSVTWPLLLPV